MTIKQLKQRQSQILKTLGVQNSSELTTKMDAFNLKQRTLVSEYNSIRLILTIV